MKRHNKLWGVGMTKPTAIRVERAIVTPKQLDHLEKFVFTNEFLEPLKATENNSKRGHRFAYKESLSTTYPRYRKHAEAEGIRAVSERVYRQVFSNKAFVPYKKVLHTQTHTHSHSHTHN